MSDKHRQSIKNKQLAATLHLKDIYFRMEDVVPDSFTRLKNKALLSLENVIVPFLENSLEKMVCSSNIVIPISGTSFIHRSNEVKRRY